MFVSLVGLGLVLLFGFGFCCLVFKWFGCVCVLFVVLCIPMLFVITRCLGLVVIGGLGFVLGLSGCV